MIPHPYPAGGGREWIERSAALIEEGRLRQFAVTLTKTGELMGCLTLRKKSVGDPEAEIAYWLGKDYWGHGYMAEAARAALNQVRVSFGVERIWAGVLVENRQSARVLEKIGLAYIDTFTDHWEVRDLDVVLLRYRMNLGNGKIGEQNMTDDVNKAAFDSRDFSAIFDHISVGVADIGRAMEFYRPALAALGLEAVMDKGFAVAFGNGQGRQWLWVSEPIDKARETVANNGAHIALLADSRAAVRAFYDAAMANGGRDDGAPGPRPEYTPTYYGAFVLDPDGNKIEAVCRKDGES